MVSYRTILMLCLVKLFILCIINISYQFIAIHRIDSSSSSYNNNLQISSPHLVHKNKNKDVPPPTKTTTVKRQHRPVIAYVVTLTGCGNDKRYTRSAAMGLIIQGAAVLRHSIELAHSNSRYDYQMYALVHPSAKECSSTISKLGYTTLIRNTPFEATDIQTKFLRENIDGASCCGRKEYIKLYAYTLVQHPVAVVLDLDSLILQPLDDLFDVLIDGQQISSTRNNDNSIPLHNGEDDSNNMHDVKRNWTNIEAFYTRDYNMVNPGGERYAGVQGGFLMVKPSEQVFEEYIDIILEGDYREGRGWGGLFGYFFGGMQIQGICAYYYGKIHPDKGIELNRCRINAMVDNPYFKGDAKQTGKCRDGRSSCEDCRTTNISDILSAHLTICQKPWECHTSWDSKSATLCSKLHSEWFRIRRSFEESRTDSLKQLPDLTGGDVYKPEMYYGYCKSPGQKGYLPVQIE